MSENRFDQFENNGELNNSLDQTMDIPAEVQNTLQEQSAAPEQTEQQIPVMEDISSDSHQKENNTVFSEQQPQTNYHQSQPNTANPYSNMQYGDFPNVNDYSAGYQDNYNADSYSVQPSVKKKSGKGKKAAMIACAIALTLCVGVGGGFLGSYLANNNPVSTVNADQSVSSKNVGGNSDSALQIIQASNTETAPTTTQEVAEKVKDAVVEITTETTTYDTFYGQYVSQGAGSGVVISADGYIITNNHVIEDAQTITVRLTDGNSYDAKLIGTDATLDVALLKIEASDLTAVTFGTSSNLKVGQTAIAIGNPLGQLGGTVTDGIISALDREIEVDGTTMTLLQTNAAINPGNSGGGLFDANGNLIGLVVAKSSSTSGGTSLEGLGFAIPVDNIINILSDLKTSGYVTGRAYLGVSVVDITDSDTAFMYRLDRTGVYVSSVSSGSAAEKAGMQAYDCIIKVGDTDIENKSQLSAALAKLKAGDKVTITVVRDGKEVKLDVTLDESVPQSSQNSANSNNGYQNGFGNFGRGNSYGNYFGSYFDSQTENSDNDI